MLYILTRNLAAESVELFDCFYAEETSASSDYENCVLEFAHFLFFLWLGGCFWKLRLKERVGGGSGARNRGDTPGREGSGGGSPGAWATMFACRVPTWCCDMYASGVQTCSDLERTIVQTALRLCTPLPGAYRNMRRDIVSL